MNHECGNQPAVIFYCPQCHAIGGGAEHGSAIHSPGCRWTSRLFKSPYTLEENRRINLRAAEFLQVEIGKEKAAMLRDECGSCRYYDCNKGCRRYPPADDRPGSRHGVYVTTNDWCGEYERRSHEG